MSADRDLWQRARPLFDELADLDGDVRRTRLAELTTGDPALHDLLESMMRADASADDALADYRFGLPQRMSSASGDAAVASSDPLGILGQTVAHFRIVSYLAAGGMGAVYSADDLRLGRVVALKFPLPHQHTDAVVKERFMHEARAAAALDHPNLCSVYEIGESAVGVFLAMPLYAGETLRDRLAREVRLTPRDTIGIARHVTRGLAAAHAVGIVHRDLKPGNVMLVPDGSAKILDFGLAKMLDVSITKSQVTRGTLVYMAPDQLRGGRVDARADLWAVGVMLYVMLTGRLPFSGEHEAAILHAILEDEPEPPSALVPGLPRAFDDLVGALLQKNPAHRYQSAEELLVDLDALETGAALRHRVPLWTRATQRKRFPRWVVPAVALAAVALVVLFGGAWAWRTHRGAAPDAERRAVATRPTANQAAYDAYLRGLAVSSLVGTAQGLNGLRPAISEFERAVALDSGFTAAHAWLARAYSLDVLRFGAGDSVLARARESAARAWRLDSTLVETRLGWATYLMATGDPAGAEQTLQAAADAAPENVDVLLYRAEASQERGRPDLVIASLLEVAALDPRNLSVFGRLAEVYDLTSRYQEAIRTREREIEIAPGNSLSYVAQAWSTLLATGDTVAARGMLERGGPSQQGDWPVSMPSLLQSAPVLSERALPLPVRRARDTVSLEGYAQIWKGYRGPERFHWMKLRHFAATGRGVEARAHADSLVMRLAPELRDRGDIKLLRLSGRAALAEAYAYLGRQADAAREADRAVAEARRSHTARNLPETLTSAAYVDVLIGQRDAAVAKLEEALGHALGGYVSRAVLRSDPSWAPLRGNTRFEALLARGPQ